MSVAAFESKEAHLQRAERAAFASIFFFLDKLRIIVLIWMVL
jgi:hypothetical protein